MEFGMRYPISEELLFHNFLPCEQQEVIAERLMKSGWKLTSTFRPDIKAGGPAFYCLLYVITDPVNCDNPFMP